MENSHPRAEREGNTLRQWSHRGEFRCTTVKVRGSARCMCTKINKGDARAPPSSRNGAHCAASQLNHETTCIFNPLNPGVACFSACLGPVAFCRLFFFACVKGYNLFLGRPTRSNGWKFNLAIHGTGLVPEFVQFDGVLMAFVSTSSRRYERSGWTSELEELVFEILLSLVPVTVCLSPIEFLLHVTSREIDILNPYLYRDFLIRNNQFFWRKHLYFIFYSSSFCLLLYVRFK